MTGAQGIEMSDVRAGAAVHAGTDALTHPTLSRRSILATIIATPVLAGLSAVPGFGSENLTAPVVAAETIVRGGLRLFHAPGLAPGARLRLPEGARVTPVEGFFENRPSVAQTTLEWPHMPVRGGEIINASIVPERNGPSRTAILSGFSQGWYEILHPNGRTDHVEWNARRLPYLLYWGEFGASQDLPFMGRFYTLGLEPFSRPPVN